MPQTTYAIGDVHGRADLLALLLQAVERDSRGSGADPRVLFLGDIVDRGPDSRQAMDLVCQTLAKWPASVLIRGNHDAWFLEFMTAKEIDEQRFERWLHQGGYNTLDSYDLLFSGSIQQAGDDFRADYPEHLLALGKASGIIVDQSYAYTHAGVDPSRPLTGQEAKTLMSIRSGFLDYEGPLSHVIVHGHTPTHDCLPEIKSNRIGIDTGAYTWGRLCCLVVSPDERDRHFLFAEDVGEGEVEIRRGHAAEFSNLPSIRQEESDDRFGSRNSTA